MAGGAFGGGEPWGYPRPVRIVSICPSNTEIACALGLADQIVGLDRSSDWPPEVTHLPRVGPDLAVDVDAIEALEPDLVLSSLSVPGMEKNLAALDARGLRHHVMDAQSIAGVFGSIRKLGQLVGRDGEPIVRAMQARLELIASAKPPRRPRVFLEWWPKPVIVPGARCWTTEMIALAGGTSIFADRDVRSVPIYDEEVPPRAPEILLTCWCGVPHDKQKPEKLRSRPGWEGIPGVVSGHVFAADEHFFGRPGPRLVDGVAWLHQRIVEWA